MRRVKSLPSKTIGTSVVALVAAVTLAGCSPTSGDDGDGETVVGVAATPAASPEAPQDPAGTVRSGDAVRGLVRVDDDTVAVLGDKAVSIGSPAAVAAGSAKTVPVDSACTSLTGGLGAVTLACGDAVKILDASGRQTRSIEVGATVTAAAVVADGTVAVTTEGSGAARWYDADGRKTDEEGVTATPSGMLLVGNGRNAASDGASDQWRVAVLDAEQSALADLDMEKRQFNAALRVGQGLGTASAGREADGVVVASDPRKGQALVYTFTDVVRHTQAVATGVSPWAVLWDSARQLMWVSTTGDNRLTAYSLSTGTPVAVGHVDTIADVRYMIDDANGGLLLIAADGTRELIPAADLPTGK